MRRRLLAALPLLGLTAVAACQPFHAGAAATVGNDRISTKQLRQESQRQTDAVAALPAQLTAGTTTPAADDVQRAVLSEQIELAVLKSYAAAHGLTVGADRVAAARATIVSNLGASDALAPGVAALSGRDLALQAQVEAYEVAVTGSLPASDAAIQQAYAASPDHEEVRAAYTFVPASNDRLGQLAAELPTTTASGFDALVQRVTGAPPAPASWFPAGTLEQYVTASALEPGKVVGPIPLQSQSGGQSVYLVLAVLAVRQVTPAGALLPDSLQRQEVQQAQLPTVLSSQEKQVGIHVSPRFGAWTFTTAQQQGGVGDLPPSHQLSLDSGSDAAAGSAPTP